MIYLLGMARKHHGKLATLDQAISSLVLEADQRENVLEFVREDSFPVE